MAAEERDNLDQVMGQHPKLRQHQQEKQGELKSRGTGRQDQFSSEYEFVGGGQVGDRPLPPSPPRLSTGRGTIVGRPLPSLPSLGSSPWYCSESSPPAQQQEGGQTPTSMTWGEGPPLDSSQGEEAAAAAAQFGSLGHPSPSMFVFSGAGGGEDERFYADTFLASPSPQIMMAAFSTHPHHAHGVQQHQKEGQESPALLSSSRPPSVLQQQQRFQQTRPSSSSSSSSKDNRI